MNHDEPRALRIGADRGERSHAPPGGGEAALEGQSAADLVAAGTAAHLAGDLGGSVRALQRAHQLHTAAGAASEALRTAFLLAVVFERAGQMSLFQGWLARAQRTLAEMSATEDADRTWCRGYVAVLEVQQALAAGRLGDIQPLSEEIAAVGHQHHDADLIALGTVAQGRLAIYGGEVVRGLALLDEAVAGVLAGETTPFIAGQVYCTAIEGCQEIGEIQRMGQWVEALQTWCSDQPGLAEFTGACSLHRGQVLALHGHWPEAITEFAAARARYELLGQSAAAGNSERERGDLLQLRGDLAGAEEAYRDALALGCDPQPGLARLWLRQGRTDAALAAVRRCLGETPVPTRRIALLPAAVEVLLRAQQTDEARGLVVELDDLAEATGCLPVAAAAAHAHAHAELAGRDPAAALPYARKAMQLWTSIGAVFERACSRLVLARALEALGDRESCSRELEEARVIFEQLGAGAFLQEAGTLFEPGTPSPAGPTGLTAREVEVLRLVASGRGNREIADLLFLSERTVARHLSNIFAKLDVRSRTAAAAYAHEHQLV
ncbi:helix-turn-helix transcriptional regulator [Ornithinimicrobium murale]|uniref:helix-turn-helix transcriptional regulator n=1 Tax=Ornithinimicrobium murale TaxID=1050153 RepID=UPI000E0DA687|nr:helix-turn-helix transcriptional regulator [Ornithinimicrobium murale]